METGPGFAFAVALGAGVVAQLLARWLRLPSIVLLLGAGVLLGPDLLGVVRPDDLGGGLFEIVSLAVAVILFEGGLNLDLSRLRHEARAVRQLVTVGALITAVGGGIAAYLLLRWPPTTALLFGTLVVVTGPTVIRPLLRYVPLRPRLATVLESEGLLIDAVGAILAAVTLEVALVPTVDSVTHGLVGLGARVVFGLAAGAVAGFGLAALLNAPHAVPEGLENLVALGGALVTFALCEAVLSESGILAVTLAGVVVGNRAAQRLGRALGEFQEHLTVGLIGVLFVLLAADVRVTEVLGLGWPGVLTVAALAFVVRPLNVWWCTRGSEISLREKAFLSWVAPRGVVAAAIASISAALLADRGAAEADEIRALVFLTIGATVVVQGGTAPWLARLLRVRAPGRDTWVVLGANEISFALADLLARDGTRLVFVDSNPDHCRAAEERGYTVVFGNAFEETTLGRVQLGRAKAVVALTDNPEVNQHFAREADDDFDVPERYVAVGRRGAAASERIVTKYGGRALFDAPKDLERWDVRLRHGASHQRRFRFVGAPKAGEDRARPGSRVDPLLVLALRRGERWLPMHRSLEPREGDVAAVVVHDPEQETAEDLLRNAGWIPAPDEEDEEPAGTEDD